MAKYAKRKDGRYSTSFIIGYNDNGKPKRKVLYGKTIRELENKIADFKSLQNKGIVINDKNLTLEEWSLKWLELYKVGKAYNTYTMYKTAVKTHIIPSLGNIRLNVLKKNNLQQLLNDLIAKGLQRTAEIVKLTLSQIINAAIENQYIYIDITRGLSLPAKQKPRKRALTDEEIEIIQKTELAPSKQLFLDVLYYTGLRRGEALALSVNDINFKDKKLSVTKTLIFKDNQPEIKNFTKTESGMREVPIPDKLMQSLNNYLSGHESVYLFTQTNGEIMSKSSFRKFWDGIIKKLKSTAENDRNYSELSVDLTPHIFRHTYATKLYYAGVDIKTAQYLLGHSSIQITLEIYTHLDRLNDAVITNKINSVFEK